MMAFAPKDNRAGGCRRIKVAAMLWWLVESMSSLEGFGKGLRIYN